MNKNLLVVMMTMALMSTSVSAATVVTSSNGGTIYNSQQGQKQQQGQQQQFYSPTATARVDNEKTKIAETTTPKTAAEQGYISNEDQDLMKEQLENYMYNNTARQKGYTIHVPTADDGVSKNKSDKMWLFNWKGRLLDKGISSEKIDFEAERLNKQDFERWASRQIRYVDEK